MIHFIKTAAALLLLLLPALAPAAGGERIIDFSSEILIAPDSTMTVTETITVYATGKKIKRGIYRDFPTDYKDRLGNRIRVGFELLEVLRDGRREGHHTKPLSNGIRIYMGEKSTYLKGGKYTYTLRYRTNRQLGYFKDFDELYWNVTGNGWDFEIERASVVITLPPGAEATGLEGYTGRQGAKGKDFTQDYDLEGKVRFTTTGKLGAREGLTIAVAWPKGFVTAPTLTDVAGYLLRDNRALTAPLLGLLLLVGYYTIAWVIAGRDPEKGVIIPQFYPPKRFTPASSRFVMKMGFDDKAFTASIVNMAVKGVLKISEEEGKDYTLTRLEGGEISLLSKGERKVFDELFSSGGEIALKQANHVRLGKAMEALKKSLKGSFEKVFFVTNSGWLAPGIILTLLTLAAMILLAEEKGAALFITVWLSIWSVACIALVIGAVSGWRTALSSGGDFAAGLGRTLFAVPFLGFELFGLFIYAQVVSFYALILFIAIIALNALFYRLLKAPTRFGRRTMDVIEGFRLYLSTAEEERLNILNPPERTPELFERYLPFALALDVEQQWCEQFAAILARAAKEEGYETTWYSGRHSSFTDMDGFASNLGSAFAGAVSSSSTAPGSSSGSGGGGSSGGGGGGGGGGGW